MYAYLLVILSLHFITFRFAWPSDADPNTTTHPQTLGFQNPLGTLERSIREYDQFELCKEVY
jgi:hypothetical protein